jgi:hypothetical protein
MVWFLSSWQVTLTNRRRATPGFISRRPGVLGSLTAVIGRYTIPRRGIHDPRRYSENAVPTAPMSS